MELDERGTDVPPPLAAAGGWQATIVVGVITLILGLIVTFHPSGSLNVIAVLLGVLLIVWDSSTWSGCSEAARHTGCGRVSRACCSS